MDINEKKEKLIRKEISIADLTSYEVEEIKENVKQDLISKKQELNDLNQKIKNIKGKIDNFAN